MSTRKVVLWVVVITMPIVAMPVNAAEMALVPVSASGPHTIVGNEIILHGAGQIVALEIRASDWEPWPIDAFQAHIDASGVASGDVGMLVPFGWDDPDFSTVCDDDLDCSEGQVCWRQEEGWVAGYCAGPNHHPQDGAFIDETHPDYIFRGFVSLSLVDLIAWNQVSGQGFRYGGFLWTHASGTYAPPPKYCGTLTLVAPPTAAGTFTMGLRGESYTYLKPDTAPFYVIFPDFTPALITVNPAECGNGICDSSEDAASCPEDCLTPPIPAASTWGLVVLGLLLLTLARVYYARKRVHVCQT